MNIDKELFLKEMEKNCLHVSKKKIIKMSESFSANGYLKIPRNTIFNDYVINSISKEAIDLIGRNSVRRDITIDTTDNTPRKMSNVNAESIRNRDEIINALYHSKPLLSLVGGIVLDELKPCWEEEWYIINHQHKKGDTHGWHWGDYPYTIIWIVQAPPAEEGGLLQCIPHTTWDKKKPEINNYFLENKISSYHHNTGDCYLLKSDTTLHRAMPITGNSERIIVNTCWTSVRDTRSEKDIDRSSMLDAFV